MKRFIVALFCVAAILPLAAEDTKPAASSDSAAPADAAYALGMLMGANVASNGLVDLDIASFAAGFKDGISGGQTKMTQAEAQAAVQTALQAAHDKKLAANLASGKAFLADNAKKTGVTVTASGLQYEVLTAGTGVKPTTSDTVKVNYEGRLLSGKVFDSSYQRGEPAVFPLANIIPGWIEALQLMPVGSKYRVYLPSELAYGEQGAGDVIEPNTVLVFDIELLEIQPPEAPAAPDSSAAPADQPAATSSDTSKK